MLNSSFKDEGKKNSAGLIAAENESHLWWREYNWLILIEKELHFWLYNSWKQKTENKSCLEMLSPLAAKPVEKSA